MPLLKRETKMTQFGLRYGTSVQCRSSAIHTQTYIQSQNIFLHQMQITNKKTEHVANRYHSASRVLHTLYSTHTHIQYTYIKPQSTDEQRLLTLKAVKFKILLVLSAVRSRTAKDEE